ncbi:MAG: dihydrofolate reductase [Pseudanabaenales cyanobacterium]|nr:dihydrofolate reductase [Pseudanabaenales cyanobacterium]
MLPPEVIIIAALAEANRVIGKDGQLPWRIPQDTQRFRRLTLGYTVIMGKNTWEYGLQKQPLRERHNIIVSSSPQPDDSVRNPIAYPFELSFVTSLQDGLKRANDQRKVFIMGGARLYAEALRLADTLELTLVEGEFEGDTFFPNYVHLVGTEFELVNVEPHPGFRFETYWRISL